MAFVVAALAAPESPRTERLSLVPLLAGAVTATAGPAIEPRLGLAAMTS